MAIRGDKTQQNAALLVAVVSSFLTPFMTAALNIALPAIGAEYRLDAGMLGWVTIAYSLAAAIFLVPFGKLSDMAGRKRVFLVGISVFTLSSALTPAMPTAALLIAARILQGLGAAMIFSTSIAILAAYFPSGERGRALGFTIAATYAGLSAGPFLGGLLVQHLGWRSVFIATVPFGILSILLLLWKLGGDWDGAPGGQFDLAGSLLYGVSLALLMYGLRRLPAAEGAVIAAVGIAGLAA
ncbi:MAG: MFS transporter, partial [Chloroflexi bacterium]|nr:MFS transporter [Chloroflexota bacterium]